MKYMEYWGGKNYFVFVGDSRIEQMYHAFIHQITPTYQWGQPYTPRTGVLNPSTMDPDFVDPLKLAHHDLSFNDSLVGLRVQYLWHPFPNKSMVSALQQWQVHKTCLKF